VAVTLRWFHEMPSPQEIIESIRHDPKVPAPSQAVFKVLELTRDPNCQFAKVAGVIGHDAGLTAELLRQVNSALYGGTKVTSSVQEACVRLGLKCIRSAVLNQHIVTGLRKTCPAGFDVSRHWQATLATSVAAHDLCHQLVPGQADDAGTAGLLCDFGIGLLAFGVPRQYQAVLKQAPPPPSPEFERIERRFLGVTHAEVGAAVLADWKLDEHVISAVRNHHCDAVSPAYKQLDMFSRIVGAAVTLSGIALNGSDMDNVALLYTQIETLAAKPGKDSPPGKSADALVTGLLEGLVKHVQNTAESYAIELGPIDQMQTNFDDLIRDLPDVGKKMKTTAMPTA
jgi:HD-like signal output (HDOD) protein